jgi:hypothetical protein
VGNGRQQFFPTLAVGPDGTIFTSWYDNRVDPTKLDVYFARSRDRGITWIEQQISAASSNPNTNEFPNNNRWGDYMGLAVSETAVYPAWTDTRNGTQDIFIKRVPANPHALAVGLGTLRSVITGGQPISLAAELLNGPSAAPVVVDLLFGDLQPNGNNITFFTDLAGGQATGTLSNPASWAPIVSNVSIQPGTDLVVPQLFQYTPIGPGTHTLFFVTRQSGTSSNITGISLKSVLVQ